MKRYAGARTIDGIAVTVDGAPLDERYDLKRYINSWFEWGYPGDAPRQLALALLADHLGDDSRALALADPFMEAVVAALDNEWELTGDEIDRALEDLPV
ncbi:MAG: DUF6166 domain-containing protein [Alphaproteobacteria bacterium]|jgi:hypothetical protein|nr:DUF6166 domain-containing protein [Alphaproteobacteria bacterium]MDH5556474.1 DUF6166 domain-containing protein [Alphaproteobacteria bacterium]